MEQQGICVKPIVDSIATDCNLPAPILADYKQWKSEKWLEELEVDDGGTFKGSSCFIPAPFLCCVLINAGKNDPLELIPMVIHAGEEFNRENATLDKDYERAVDNVEFFVDWLWGISKNNVGVTNFIIWAGDAETSKELDQHHKDWIMGSTNTVDNSQPLTSDSTDVLRQLTEGISAKMKWLKRQISWQGKNLTERNKIMTRRRIEYRSCILLFLTCC